MKQIALRFENKASTLTFFTKLKLPNFSNHNIAAKEIFFTQRKPLNYLLNVEKLHFEIICNFLCVVIDVITKI